MDKAMLKLENKSIAQAIFVAGYKRDLEIMTKQFEIEKAFKSIIPAVSVNTNIDDNANPQAARVILSNGLISAHFTQVSAQLNLDINDKDWPGLDDIKKYIIHNVTIFQECLCSVVPLASQLERGLVVAVKYPVDIEKYSDVDIFGYIQDKFISLPSFGLPASASLNVGYKTDDNYYISLGISQYKMASSEIPIGSSGLILDFSSLPISETGIELKVDINSRPLLNTSNTKDVTGTILNKVFDFIYGDADKIMGIK